MAAPCVRAGPRPLSLRSAGRLPSKFGGGGRAAGQWLPAGVHDRSGCKIRPPSVPPKACPERCEGAGRRQYGLPGIPSIAFAAARSRPPPRRGHRWVPGYARAEPGYAVAKPGSPGWRFPPHERRGGGGPPRGGGGGGGPPPHGCPDTRLPFPGAPGAPHPSNVADWHAAAVMHPTRHRGVCPKSPGGPWQRTPQARGGQARRQNGPAALFALTKSQRATKITRAPAALRLNPFGSKGR
jgi:hypothetical protein